MLNKNQKGFTLIELLIVIVIIGILAGVLVAIINPAQQQMRARDANVKASLNKLALATQGFISAYGRAPNDVEFLASLDNKAESGLGGTSDCSNADNNDTASICMISITGNTLPTGNNPTNAGCAANGWNGMSTNQCFFRYWRPAGAGGIASSHFRLYAKSFGVANTVFMFSNMAASIQDCAASGATIVADVDTAACR